MINKERCGHNRRTVDGITYSTLDCNDDVDDLEARRNPVNFQCAGGVQGADWSFSSEDDDDDDVDNDNAEVVRIKLLLFDSRASDHNEADRWVKASTLAMEDDNKVNTTSFILSYKPRLYPPSFFFSKNNDLIHKHIQVAEEVYLSSLVRLSVCECVGGAQCVIVLRRPLRSLFCYFLVRGVRQNWPPATHLYW